MGNLHYIISTNSMVIFKLGLKPCPNDRNISLQQIATWLGATCCARLAILLRGVASGYDMSGVVGQFFHATFVDVA